MHTTAPMLQAWWRTLWHITPTLHPLAAGDIPFLSDLGVHLPMGSATTLAAAAHAGAHLVYSRPGASTAGLRPTTRVLAGLLEDARVEWLAARELPGLRRLWRSCQPASAPTGTDAASLLERLAHALADEHHVDPHPWIVKARRLMFVDEGQQVLALRQFEAVRQAASLLGNDLGQMRLPLDARAFRVSPTYRDNNQWLWATDAPPAGHGAPPDTTADASHAVSVAATAPGGATFHYPEWDRRIARHRPDWTTVVETVAPSAPVAAEETGTGPLRGRLATVLRRPDGAARQRLRRQPEGDMLDLEALVRAWSAGRNGGDVDTRVFIRTARRPRPGHVLLMLDTSASSAERVGPAGSIALALTRTATRLCAEALEGAGHRCAIQAFASDGRTAVHVQQVKAFTDPMDTRCEARLAGLGSRWSTRLGAAIRHGTQVLQQAPRGRARHLVVVTDGEPHDIDVFEPHYLSEDARHAVFEARRQGVHVFCFGLQPASRAVLRRVFGAGRYHDIARLSALPEAMARACR